MHFLDESVHGWSPHQGVLRPPGARAPPARGKFQRLFMKFMTTSLDFWLTPVPKDTSESSPRGSLIGWSRRAKAGKQKGEGREWAEHPTGNPVSGGSA